MSRAEVPRGSCTKLWQAWLIALVKFAGAIYFKAPGTVPGAVNTKATTVLDTA
jgi:hypothetical protein